MGEGEANLSPRYLMSEDSEDVTVAYDELIRDDDAKNTILFRIGDDDVWLPRGEIRAHDEDDKCVTIGRWLAYDRDLI